jgi:hypothetical protein
MGIYGSSGRATNPMGGLGVVIGVVGAAFSVILWIHYFDPTSRILGETSIRIINGDLHEQLDVLAFAFGVMAVVSGISGGLGGRGSSTTVASLLLGIVALSYPVMNWLSTTSSGIRTPLG